MIRNYYLGIHEKKTDKIRKAEESFFYFGKYYLRTREIERDIIMSGVAQLIVHPDYNAQKDSYDGDIALAVLLRSIIFTKFIKPICIWTQSSNFNDLVDKNGIIAGM